MIPFYKGEPNNYVIKYSIGRIVKQGVGLSFWYLPFNTSIAEVPALTQEGVFIFKESTANFQEITIQGLFSYRLTDPVRVAEHLDYRIDIASGNYLSEDPERLKQRIVNAVQSYTRSGVNDLSLEKALVEVKGLASDVLEKVQREQELIDLGVEVTSLHFNAVQAEPEMHKALEADYRENLKKRADQAIYARRVSALEEERKLKHSEINTEVEIEKRRTDLVVMQAENNLTLAEADAKAEEMKLTPYGDLAPQALVGLALKEWAGNAGKVESLNIGADMLSQIIGWIGQNERKQSSEQA